MSNEVKVKYKENGVKKEDVGVIKQFILIEYEVNAIVAMRDGSIKVCHIDDVTYQGTEEN